MPKKERKRKPEEYCQMKPLRDCLNQNDGKIERCVKEVEIFEKSCDSGRKYFHSREGLDDSKSGLFSGKRHL
ncbi:hypothetical protein TpMuguga_03g00440 [Theileria parva strain Muguga]|uniref:Uncharacterized protein n=1 Tax=Theileria parva TaxID=5875 RepID=Q4MZS2_THEPA|nr:uncharacterized protein TpMuguga_03g00440 [Theileria parva strain Muguga]EAN31177.1 hypothetical protein TpMuguga_03g00440 [Theileria parva strain Muguga]|eukprot:XP_763460.1 hypothetical protein [Theileria parva strain Muguga]